MDEHGGQQASPDLDALRAFAFKVFSNLQGFMVAGTIYLGEQLGLYRALAERGPTSADELAAATGLHARWVLEWLRAQGAAGLLEHMGDDRFLLIPAGREVLANDGSVLYAAGAFAHLPMRAQQFTETLPSFETGIGHPFDARGAEGAEATERLFGNWYRQMLVPVMIPALAGVPDKLAGGSLAADIGCGAGVALIELARAFPHADLHGYDISRHALERAEKNRAEAGVANITFHDATVDPLPDDHRFDLVMTLDCVHDMTAPGDVLAALRRAVAEDGTWLWAEPKALPTYDQNVERNPMAAMMYSTSIFGCMSSAMSEPGGAGLGTLGISEPKARQMAEDAGFSRFQVHDFGNPVNIYYEVGP